MRNIFTATAFFLASLNALHSTEIGSFKTISTNYDGKTMTWSIPSDARLPSWAPLKILDFSESIKPGYTPGRNPACYVVVFPRGKRDRKTELFPVTFEMMAVKLSKKYFDDSFDIGLLEEIIVAELGSLDRPTLVCETKVIDFSNKSRGLQLSFYDKKSHRKIQSRSYVIPMASDVIVFFRVMFEGNPSVEEVSAAFLLLNQIVDSVSLR